MSVDHDLSRNRLAGQAVSSVNAAFSSISAYISFCLSISLPDWQINVFIK